VARPPEVVVVAPRFRPTSNADRGPLPSTAAKSYRIFRAILNTAVQDQLIARNPCAIRGAGQDPPKDRAFVPADVVLELVDAAHPRLAPMILLAAFRGLRYGELRALRRRHYDAVAGTVSVEEALDKRTRRKSPKTAASRRVVHLPTFVLDALNEHVNNLNQDLNEGATTLNDYLNSPLLPGLAGGVMSDGWHKREWILARKAVGVPGIRFHDLRHTAGTLAAQQGATLKEVMARLGHATTAAAIRYQRAAETRDKEIADRLDSFVIDLNERRERREFDAHRANRAGWLRDGIDERTYSSSPNGIRTRAATLRGWCPRPLDDGAE
jgi:integrase